MCIKSSCCSRKYHICQLYLSKDPDRRRQWHPTPVLLPGKSHVWRSLVGCSPWGREELDTTEWFHFHFSLSCIGEGNGNPLQCSCLENPRDGGAWWAAIYGVTQSGTRLKWLSSSSSCMYMLSLHHCTHREADSHCTETRGQRGNGRMCLRSLPPGSPYPVATRGTAWKWKLLSPVQLFATPWTVA